MTPSRAELSSKRGETAWLVLVAGKRHEAAATLPTCRVPAVSRSPVLRPTSARALVSNVSTTERGNILLQLNIHHRLRSRHPQMSRRAFGD
jgi:hypothetical protein